MNPQVAVIILNWNGWEDTLECLESLYAIKYPNYVVVLADNASEDESITKIKEYCKGKIEVNSNYFDYNVKNKPITVFDFFEDEMDTFNEKSDYINSLSPQEKLILIKNHQNYGFAGGNNIAVENIIDVLNPDYILLLNNDTVVDEVFLDELVNIAESNSKIGAVGPKTYFYDEKNLIQWTGGGFIDPKYLKAETNGSFQIDDGQFDENFEIDYISGSCILCKREVIKKVGLLDHTYFMYFEDDDWCLRIKNAGYKCMYAYKSKIWHKMGVSSDDCFKTYYYYRNRVYLFKKNYKKTKFYYSLLRFVFAIFPKESYGFMLKGIKYYFKCYLKGTLNGIFKKI